MLIKNNYQQSILLIMLITYVRLDSKRKNGVDKSVDNYFILFCTLYLNQFKIQWNCDRVHGVWL